MLSFLEETAGAFCVVMLLVMCLGLFYEGKRWLFPEEEPSGAKLVQDIQVKSGRQPDKKIIWDTPDFVVKVNQDVDKFTIAPALSHFIEHYRKTGKFLKFSVTRYPSVGVVHIDFFVEVKQKK